ncbi:hypothetical protein ABZP36_025769 [Zizania latifolia]
MVLIINDDGWEKLTEWRRCSHPTGHGRAAEAEAGATRRTAPGEGVRARDIGGLCGRGRRPAAAVSGRSGGLRRIPGGYDHPAAAVVTAWSGGGGRVLRLVGWGFLVEERRDGASAKKVL